MGIGALLAASRGQVSACRATCRSRVFNNLEIASYLTPTVTTVGLQLSALGAEGVELLVDRPPGEGINQTVSKPAELFIRDSTGRPPPPWARRPAQNGEWAWSRLTWTPLASWNRRSITAWWRIRRPLAGSSGRTPPAS